MQVSGTAFQDLTNSSTQPWQRSTLSSKQQLGSIARSAAGTHAQQQASVPELGSNSQPAHAARSDRLTAEHAQRQSRRMHRKRVARIVADQWKWFTKERIRTRAAVRHHSHRLLLSSLLALQRHSAHRRLEWRRAAIFNHRRQYLTQGRCLLLWHAQLDYSKKVQQKLMTARLVRHNRQKRACFYALWEYKRHKAESRKQKLQADFYRSFVLLTSAVQQWVAAATASAAKKAKINKALSCWAIRQYSKAFDSWQSGRQLQQHAHQMKQQADDWRKHKLSMAVLQHWQTAIKKAQSTRTTASHALQVLQLSSARYSCCS